MGRSIALLLFFTAQASAENQLADLLGERASATGSAEPWDLDYATLAKEKKVPVTPTPPQLKKTAAGGNSARAQGRIGSRQFGGTNNRNNPNAPMMGGPGGKALREGPGTPGNYYTGALDQSIRSVKGKALPPALGEVPPRFRGPPAILVVGARPRTFSR